MSVKQFKKSFAMGAYAGRAEFNGSQNHLEQVLTPITNSRIVDGVYLREVDLTASVDNLVKHKLGREPLGWVVVRKFANVTIWESLTATIGGSSSSYDRKKFINFQVSSTTTNVYFWIF
jgi:hypothetical protein